MRNNSAVLKCREKVKHLVYRSKPIKYFLILIYKILGKKPWSLGYSVFKYGFIRNVVNENIHMFDDGGLPSGYGYALDERVVEYPWFFSRLKNNEQVILDAGSSLNHFDILAVNKLERRKLYITTLSCEGIQEGVNAPIYTYEDMRGMSYNDEFFDAVVCISSLEHVGMDNSFIYTSDKSKIENEKYAYLAAVNEFKRVLKKGGTLYLTVPYGKYKNHKLFQIFDTEMVVKLKEAFSPAKISEAYFKYEHKQWNYSNAQACQDGYYFDIHHERKYHRDYLAASQSVVCLEMTK